MFDTFNFNVSFLVSNISPVWKCLVVRMLISSPLKIDRMLVRPVIFRTNGLIFTGTFGRVGKCSVGFLIWDATLGWSATSTVGLQVLYLFCAISKHFREANVFQPSELLGGVNGVVLEATYLEVFSGGRQPHKHSIGAQARDRHVTATCVYIQQKGSAVAATHNRHVYGRAHQRTSQELNAQRPSVIKN